MNVSTFLATALFAAVLLPFAASAGQADGLTKENVQTVLDSLDKAFVMKDAAAVTAHFTSNAVITATVIEDGRKDSTTNSTSSYRALLESSFSAFSDYKLTRTNLAIEISAGGKTASTKSTLIETFTFGGKAKRAVTRESASIEVIDGKILVTKSHDDVVVE